MKRHLQFKIERDSQLSKKVFNYFDRSGFKLVEQNDNCLKFTFNSRILDTWIFNPLKWKSDIVVLINDKEIKAKFLIDTSAQIVTAEVKEAWQVFIDNFRQYIIDGIEFEEVNTEAVKRARQSILKLTAWTILAIAVGGIIGACINHFIRHTFMTYIGLILGAHYFLRRKLISNRRIHRL
jgi:hypothetical protein